MARRNNKSRVGASTPDLAQSMSMKGGLVYEAPTEFVELPTKGKLYPEGHPFHLREEVEIRYMTAKDEDILSSQTLINRGVAIDRFIENILVDEGIDSDSLYIGDKNAIIVAARATGYGPDYECSVSCPACGAKSDYTFNLLNAPIKELPSDVKFTSNGTFLVDLPKTGFTAELRLLTTKEQRYLTELAESKRKKNLRESSSTDLLKMIVTSVGDVSNRAEIEKFIDNLPSSDSLEIRRVYSKVTPNIDLTQDFECPSCNVTTALEVPLGADFFWPR